MGASPIFTYTYDSLVHTNLSDPAVHLNYMTCLPTSDTMMMDNCGTLFHRRHSNMDSTCFEPQIWYSDLYAGLGGPYYYVYDPVGGGAPGSWFSKTLLYYNTAQHGECGTFMSVAGIESPAAPATARMYPNPAQTYVYLELPSNNWSYTIYGLDGTLLREANVEQTMVELNIQDFPSGIYLVKIGTLQDIHTLTLCVQ